MTIEPIPTADAKADEPEDSVAIPIVSDKLQTLLHNLSESAGKFNELIQKIYEQATQEGLNDLFITLLMRRAVKGKLSEIHF
jgi:hypothetical protein